MANHYSHTGQFSPASDAIQNHLRYSPGIFTTAEAREIVDELVKAIEDGELEGLFQDEIGEPANYTRKSLHGTLNCVWAAGASDFPNSGEYSSSIKRRRDAIIQVHKLIGALREELDLRKGSV